MDEVVKLIGVRNSPFCCRVECALKLKGVKYEYVTEDLSNKSDLLLQYNPVHKKIPVLVHGGKAVVESMIILEYIEETWPEVNPLLPADLHERSVARFWIKFIEDKCLSIWQAFRTKGEQQAKALADSLEMLKTIEEHAMTGKAFFNGDNIGSTDLAFGILVYWSGVIEEAIQVKILDAQTFPRITSWKQRFMEVPEIKDCLPNYDELVSFFKLRREMVLAAAETSS
ncbi:probable glutathione S-transferase [Papaver somniferum]|uniref:probable glutathione S-transferase n=1 Tax=Papaver somniferum TaxID=3469 RepID=UPI000E6FEAAB|nr:probable glutathione S-transferase [Papaver somniferum]